MTRSVLALTFATVFVSPAFIGSVAFAEHPEHPSPQLSAQQLPHQEKLPSSPSDYSQADASKLDSISQPDEKFLKDFARINAAKVETGKLAEWKAEYVVVKAFAQLMIDTHTGTIGKLSAIAAQRNVDVPAKPNLRQKTKAAILDINAGASFDRAYLKSMVNDYEEIVPILEQEIKDGQDASVKQLASQGLVDARKHLEMAQELYAKVSADQDTLPANRTLARNGSSGQQKVAASK